jgi:hypothetical protein
MRLATDMACDPHDFALSVPQLIPKNIRLTEQLCDPIA